MASNKKKRSKTRTTRRSSRDPMRKRKGAPNSGSRPARTRRRAETPLPLPAAPSENERLWFLDLLDTLPIYLILLSEDYRVPYANRFFRERFGESRGRRCYEYLFRRKTPCKDCQAYRVLVTRAPHRWEWRGPDGREYDIHDFPFRSADGSTLILETGIDITERKRAEYELSRMNAELEQHVARRTADLAASEQRCATTLSSIGDAVIVTDMSGRITFMNPAAETLTGWGSAEAAGRPIRKVFRTLDGEKRKSRSDPVSKVLSSGAAAGLSNGAVLVRKDGAEIPIDDSASPIHGADGKVDGVVLIFRDITLRRENERQIRNLAKFPGENPNPVLRVDRSGKILFANDACRMLPDVRLEAESGLPPELAEMVKRAFAGRKAVTAELNAGEAVLQLTAVPLREEGYANIYGADITERRRKEKELLRLNRTLQAIGESNQAMMQGRDEKEFAQEICRIIDDCCGYSMIWIGIAEQDKAKTVRPVAHSGFEAGYLETLHITWADEPRGRGPTGVAIRTGEPAVCRDMRTDLRFKPWRAEALKRGYASSIALPFKVDDRISGAIMIYAPEPDAFPDEEVALLKDLAGDLGYGIQAIRLRAVRKELLQQMENQRRLAQQLADELGTIFTSMSDALLVYNAGGKIQHANAAAVRILGFDPQAMNTPDIVSRLATRLCDSRPLDPAESPAARALRGTAVKDERFLIRSSSGQEKIVSASSEPLREGKRITGAVTVIHDVTEQEHLAAEEQRWTSELETVIRSITDGVLISDADGRLLRANPAARRILDYSQEDFHLTYQDRVFSRMRIKTADGEPLDSPEKLPMLRALKGETVIAQTLLVERLKSGERVWVLANAAPLRDGAGKIFGAVTTLTDISQRQETEKRLEKIRNDLELQVQKRTRELEEANAYNRSLIEASIDPLMTITPEGKIGDANPAAEEVTGYARTDLIGRDFSSLFTDEEKARTAYRLVFDKGRVSDCELEIRRRDGHITPVLYNASVFTDETRNVKAAIAAARDITRRRRAEALSRRFLRRVEVTAEISHLLVEAGLDFRPALAGIAEAVADVLGEECRIYLPTDDGRLHPAATARKTPDNSGLSAYIGAAFPGAVLQRVFQNRRPLFLRAGLASDAHSFGEAERKASPESPLPSSLIAVPLSLQETALGVLTAARYAPGRPYSTADLTMLQTVADRLALAITNANLFADLKNALSEEQKTRQQLVQSEKLAAMGRMLGSVAHELNNPLQTIKNCLYLVKQDVPETEATRDALEMASSETNRLVHLVAQLRELYRPHSEKSMLPNDLGAVLRGVRSLLAPQLERGKVEWRETDGAQSCTVPCDKERIQQVFINLATNAIEAMQPDGGVLSTKLVSAEDAPTVGAVFQDTGPGVPPELLHNLFDPFVTTKPNGLGLGLSICYEIAQKHGGTISVENPPGGGAVFTLWLPQTKKR